ncbi:MAG: hypothetical protein OXU79_13985 [Gemmatimonadota bacterium]|nr:hypothetical protein [Gemmatimonadota bacterium]
MIRAFSNSFLALGFVLALVHCLCGAPVQAEACHGRPVEADCCCAANSGNVSGSPAELPPVQGSTGPRFPGPESHAVWEPVRPPVVPASLLSPVNALLPVAAFPRPAPYLMKTSFLI